MKKILIPFLLLSLVFTTTSCEDLLDAFDTVYMTLDDIPRDGEDILGDTWVITDSYAYSANDFDDLVRAITSANRDISVELPNMRDLPAEAFYNCSRNLVSVKLNVAIEIGDYAFENCESLYTVWAPKADYLGYGSFLNCRRLELFYFPTVSEVDGQAFKNCKYLQQAIFQEAISVGEEAFSGCSDLRNVSMLELDVLFSSAFEYCTSLERVNLPVITSIYPFAFSDCDNLSELTLATDSYVYSISYSAFSGVDLRYTDLITGYDNGTKVDGRYWIVDDNDFGPFSDISRF